MAKRSYGSGSLYVRKDAAGNESWYGHWRHNGRQVKRRIGPKRAPGSREGLTRKQAEAELRRLIGEVQVKPQAGEALSVAEVSVRYVAHAKRRGRKPSTIANIESETRVHLAPFFGERSMDSIRPADVLDLIGTLEGKGHSPKTIRNVVATLSALFNFAKAPQRRWAAENPCEGLELPAVPESTEIRFLSLEEVGAAIANVPKGIYQAIDRAMILTAAMTGLRKGELVALRWRDIDWPAARIRVRQNYVRGQFGTPKSKRSTRSVPMADEVGGELERLFKRSRFQGDDDLAFTLTGEPLPKANITRRFRKALKAAGLDDSRRFHDLRHTFGTRMAATGEVPMRTLQEWMGHRDLATTQIYADYAPSVNEGQMIARAFARGSNPGSNLSESEVISENVKAPISRGNDSA
ncbi:MAG: tyrosine-type recombinase/integrase [Solirubrobacterales bacterium]